MPFIAIRRWADLDAAERARVMARSTAAVFEPGLVASIERLFEEVRTLGDVGVIAATERFDGVRLTADRLWVTEDEIDAAHAACPPALLDGIRLAIATSREFNEAQVAHTAVAWRTETRPGRSWARCSGPSRRRGCSSRPARPRTRRCCARSARPRWSPGCRRSS